MCSFYISIVANIRYVHIFINIVWKELLRTSSIAAALVST